MKTNIEWTDVTDNIIVVVGGGWWCRKISEGCTNCYAAKLNQIAFFGGNKLPYSGRVPDIMLRTEVMERWPRLTKPRKHFVASMTDVFGEWVPRHWVFQMLDQMAAAPLQTFQVLTKRPDVALGHIKAWLMEHVDLHELPSNIWIGATVENQKWAVQRIPVLWEIPAAVRFLSCEPLLGPLDLSPFLERAGGIQWIICGGESGTEARPMHPRWAQSLRDQCEEAGTAFFFKQWGTWGLRSSGSFGAISKTLLHDFEDGTQLVRSGKKTTGRILDGRTHDQFPRLTA